MDYISRFERVETKYILNPTQLGAFLPRMAEHMEPDGYGETTICSLYMDTADDLLVRRSLEKPKYKEKMRLRSYGVPGENGRVFLEIKKKVKGVVYKRRMDMTVREAMAYLLSAAPLGQGGQIAREIDYMKNRYGLYPKVYVAYDRVAYLELGAEAKGVRVTVDRNVRSRETDLDLRLGDAGRLLLPEGTAVMEIKTLGAYPLWLVSALAESRVYPGSFSKYGAAYQTARRCPSPLSRTGLAEVRYSAMYGGFSNAYSPV